MANGVRVDSPQVNDIRQSLLNLQNDEQRLSAEASQLTQLRDVIRNPNTPPTQRVEATRQIQFLSPIADSQLVANREQQARVAQQIEQQDLEQQLLSRDQQAINEQNQRTIDQDLQRL